MPNPNKLIKNAMDAATSGNIDYARTLIHKIKDYRSNHAAINILALCHAMKGEFSDAEMLFTKSIKLSKPTALLLGNLGLTQHHQQKIPEAIQSYRQAIGLNSNHYDALSNLATCYDYINDEENAIIYAKKANTIKPDNPEVINIIAKHMLYKGKIQNAIDLYTQSLSIQPQQPHTYVQLSNANYLAKKYDNAEQILKKSVIQFADMPYILISLGGFYESRNRYDEAIPVYDRVLNTDKNNTVSIAAKARCLIALKQYSLASDILKKAQEKYIDNPEINAELCNYLILTKDYETAYNISSKLITTIKNDTAIPVNIALSHSTACRHSGRLKEARKTLTDIVNRSDVSRDTLETISYSLGDVLDKMKNYDEAFSTYKIANEVSPRPSDISYYETLLINLAKTIDRDFLDNIGSSDNHTSLPVFIVGMPRSGTSLVEQILSSHPDIFGGGELTELWKIGNSISQAMNMLEYSTNFSKLSKHQLTEYSENYLKNLLDISNGESRVTDKLPHNFMHIGLIECLFPDAKIIHCQRHPFDTCLSIYFRQFNDNNVYARNLEEVALFYKRYMQLMEHWNDISSLPILTVKYEDLIENQEAKSRHLINHIGLDWNKDVLHYFNSDRVIMTPSYHQASKPIYTSSLYRWKNYNKHIGPLVKILGEPEEYM